MVDLDFALLHDARKIKHWLTKKIIMGSFIFHSVQYLYSNDNKYGGPSLKGELKIVRCVNENPS